MPYTPTELSAVADFEKARDLYVSLHTANPGTTGASEGTAARVSASWGTSSNGVTTVTVTFPSAPAATYTHFGLFSASTAGTFYGGNPLSASVTLSAAGPIQVTVTLTVTSS